MAKHSKTREPAKPVLSAAKHEGIARDWLFADQHVLEAAATARWLRHALLVVALDSGATKADREAILAVDRRISPASMNTYWSNARRALAAEAKDSGTDACGPQEGDYDAWIKSLPTQSTAGRKRGTSKTARKDQTAKGRAKAEAAAEKLAAPMQSGDAEIAAAVKACRAAGIRPQTIVEALQRLLALVGGSKETGSKLRAVNG